MKEKTVVTLAFVIVVVLSVVATGVFSPTLGGSPETPETTTEPTTATEPTTTEQPVLDKHPEDPGESTVYIPENKVKYPVDGGEFEEPKTVNATTLNSTIIEKKVYQIIMEIRTQNDSWYPPENFTTPEQINNISGHIIYDNHTYDVPSQYRPNGAEPPLGVWEWNDTVSSVARAHSEDMYDKNHFSHGNTEGLHATERYHETGRNGGYSIGENLVAFPISSDSQVNNDDVAQTIVLSWWDSKGHHDTMLIEGWGVDGVGVGVYVGEPKNTKTSGDLDEEIHAEVYATLNIRYPTVQTGG